MLVALHGWIPELLELHLENLETLWHQRVAMAGSAVQTLRDLRRLDARIEAHVDALVLAGESAHAVLGAGLCGPTAGLVCGAGQALLRGGTWATLVWDTAAATPGPVRAGLTLALQAGPITAVVETLRAAAAGPDLTLAVLAARILAVHGAAGAERLRLKEFLRSPDPALVTGALELAALLPADPATEAEVRRRCADPDPGIRRAALAAAAWHRREWLADLCRPRATTDGEALRMLALLAEPRDLDLLITASRNPALGTVRWEALGLSGLPGAVPTLASAMAGKDLSAAVAAGRAFEQLSGERPWSPVRCALPPADPTDALAAEFAESAFVPEARVANDWGARAGGAAARLLQGRPLDSWLAAPESEDLPVRAVSDLRLLSHVRGIQTARPLAHLFPAP